MNPVCRAFSLSLLATITVGPFAAGCAVDEVVSAEDDLTSVTARERALSFDGYVYVSANASDYEIQQAITRQTKSGFGALRTATIGVNDRELKDVDFSNLSKEPVEVVDEAGGRSPALRVRYTFTDRALVPVSMAKRSAIHLGLLHGAYQSQSKRILEECTENTKHDQEFESSLWYVFNPSLSRCQDAIEAEEFAIQEKRKSLGDPENQIVPEEKGRLYLPVTFKLEGKATSGSATYPEYDRLWRGGIEADKVNVAIVSGVMADWAAGEKPELADDIGYRMFYEQMVEIEKELTGLELVSADGVDLSTFTANGKTVSGVTWNDLKNWELKSTGFPSQFSSSKDRRALKLAVAAKVAKHWLRFEQPATVSIDGEPARDVTVVIKTYYGAETSDAPHREAMRSNDVVIYNGHSYIGYGPLDPSRYDESDFPSSYQLFFFNSCVSFNYYEKDFFVMHPGGTANLDMITNGLESWVNGSGPSVGRFVGNLLNGKQTSYLDLLHITAKGTYPTEVGIDGLRVVDGELDNTFKPSKTTIEVDLK